MGRSTGSGNISWHLSRLGLRLICGHIDGGTTRCSPPPIRKGGFDEPHLLRSPVSGHGKRTQLALERGQGWR